MTILQFFFWSLLKVIVVTVVMLLGVAYTVLLERKLVGRIQNRWGPSRVGPFGLLQPLVDGAKLFLKEDLIPTGVYRPLYLLAPIIALGCALISIAVVPFGSPTVTGPGGFHFFEISDVNIGLLVILGITSIGVYGIALAGWSSNNKYSLLGSLRSSAQLISYELALGLSLVGVVLRAGSLNLRDDCGEPGDARAPDVESLWRVAVCRVLHLPDGGVCGDQPLALRSARGGERTDGGLSHRVQLDEVRHVLHGRVRQHDHGGLRGHAAVSGRMDEPVRRSDSALPQNIVCRRSFPIFWFVLKVFCFLFLYVWVRGTLPRFRYDQLMNFGWRFLLPLAILNIVGTSLWLCVPRY